MKEGRCGTCMTCDELVEMLTAAIQEMSPMEKAQLRIELRKSNGLPYVPEPEAWVN
jgi:hypothetical protein